MSHDHGIWFDLDGLRYCQANLNFNQLFNTSDSTVYSSIVENRLENEKILKYGIVAFDTAFISDPNYDLKDFSHDYNEISYKKTSNATEMKFVFMDDQYFNSERFSDYYTIIDGSVPSSTNEFLIDYGMAMKLNLSAGDITNITTRIGLIFRRSYRHYPVSARLGDFVLHNLTISGVYVPRYNNFSINQEYFHYSYTINDYLDSKPYSEAEGIDSPAIFTFYNFSGPDWAHPVQALYSAIKNSSWESYTSRVISRSGYILSYPRESINYQRIGLESQQLGLKIENISLYLPSNVGIVNILGLTLDRFAEEMNQTRIFLQMFHLPLISFTIMFGVTFRDSIEKKRMEEMYLLRAKGVSNSFFVGQMLSESVVFGIFEATIGNVLGFLTLYGFWYVLGPDFLIGDHAQMIPSFSSFALIFSYFIAIFLNILIYFPLILKTKKSRYDNHSNFGSLTIDGQSNDYSTPKKIKKLQSHIKKKPRSSNRLQKQYEDREESARMSKETLILLLLGMIPLLFYGLLFLSFYQNLSDSLLDIINFIFQNKGGLEIFTLFCMLLAISGVTRVLFYDSPYVMNKLIGSVSKVFVKDLNFFVVTDLIQKKKWVNIMTLFGWISALFLAFNFLSFSKANLFLIQNGCLNSTPSQIFHVGSPAFYRVLYQFFLFSGIIIASIIGIGEAIIYKENDILNKSLFLRGLNAQHLWGIILFESIVVFFFGTGIGLIIGLGYFLLIFNFDVLILLNNLSLSLDYQILDYISGNVKSLSFFFILEIVITLTILIIMVRQIKKHNPFNRNQFSIQTRV